MFSKNVNRRQNKSVFSNWTLPPYSSIKLGDAKEPIVLEHNGLLSVKMTLLDSIGDASALITTHRVRLPNLPKLLEQGFGGAEDYLVIDVTCNIKGTINDLPFNVQLDELPANLQDAKELNLIVARQMLAQYYAPEAEGLLKAKGRDVAVIAAGRAKREQDNLADLVPDGNKNFFNLPQLLWGREVALPYASSLKEEPQILSFLLESFFIAESTGLKDVYYGTFSKFTEDYRDDYEFVEEFTPNPGGEPRELQIKLHKVKVDYVDLFFSLAGKVVDGSYKKLDYVRFRYIEDGVQVWRAYVDSAFFMSFWDTLILEPLKGLLSKKVKKNKA